MDTTKYNHNALTNNIDTLGTDVLALKDLLRIRCSIEDGKAIIFDRDMTTNVDHIISVTTDRIADQVGDLETIIYDLARSQKTPTDQREIENNNQDINEGVQ